MKHPRLRKVLPATLAALLTTCSLVPALAAENATEKEEIVYANLSASGEVSQVYVVNAFDLDEPQTIYDYGAYTGVKNLSTSDTIVCENGQVSLMAPAGRFYYQGALETKQLPWRIEVGYKLDGAAVDASDLAGRQGHLEITVDITRNKEIDPSFFDTYALQATLTLNTDDCKNIVADGATIANVGTNKQLTYTLLPGSEKSFVIQSDVRDFEMDGLSINGVSLALDIDANSLDVSSFTGQLSTLQTAVARLDQGAQQVKSGTFALQNGLDQIAANSTSLNDASAAFLSAIGQIGDGADELKARLSALPGGLNSAVGGLDQVTAQSEQEKQLLAALQTSSDPQVQALVKLYQAKMAGIKGVRDGLDSQKQAFSALPGALDSLTGSLAALEAKYGTFHSALTAYTGGVDTAQQKAGLLTDGAAQLASGTGTMHSETATLDEKVAQELQKAIDSFAGKDIQPVSFVSRENTQVKSVQFALKTADIHKPDVPVPAEEQAPTLSFWQRLSDLF